MNRSLILLSVSIGMERFLNLTGIKNNVFHTEIYKKFKVETFLMNTKKGKKLFYLDDQNNLKTVIFKVLPEDKVSTVQSVVIDVISNGNINQINLIDKFNDDKVTDIRNLILFPIIQKWFDIVDPQFFNNKIVWKSQNNILSIFNDATLSKEEKIKQISELIKE